MATLSTTASSGALLALNYDSGEEVKDDEMVTVISCRRLPIELTTRANH